MSLGLEFNSAGINIITESQSPDNNHCKATFFLLDTVDQTMYPGPVIIISKEQFKIDIMALL